MLAVIEIEGFEYFENLVDKYDSAWGEDIYLYRGMNLEEFGEERLMEWYPFDRELLNIRYSLESVILRHFDFESFAEELLLDSCHKYFSGDGGIIEI